ncbi:hypothetical protein HF086_017073 [Spodoptera exigua]|uniref:DUF5641 domain-containing protein n=1 Tax=Spodoptera exigua TaxID=7107 RepID=A0A922SGH5_SPOEX|nr:hypothetical protein HF086_017073 [Spodoptera exigua]
MKRSSVHTALCQTESSLIIELLNKYNSLTKVVRTLAWVSRYIYNLRNKNSRLAKNTLTYIELQSALYLVVKHTQSIDFSEDILNLKRKGNVRSSSKLSCLRQFLDKDGILRVGGRLEQASITYAAKHPIILSPGSRLAELIIHQAHIYTLHGGLRLTLSFIREKYWLLSGISSVKKQLRLCVKCRRYSQESYQQLMADLPKPRITPSRPFTNVGIDFTGHVEIKSNKGRGIKTTKGYIASINKHFWKRWSTEYLQQLQVRTKWRAAKANLRVDDLALIKEDNMPPGKWAMARVEELHPGQDGYVRVVTLKTANNIIKRPVNKLIPLPVQEMDTTSGPTPSDSRQGTQTRRNQSKFSMKSLFTSALILLMMTLSPSI